MTKKNFTKVICQNCGAEVIIPAEESVEVGRVIGKNSGLGTIVLPTKTNGCGCSCEQKETPVSALDKLMTIAEDSPEMMGLIRTLIDGIDQGGYLDVQNIVRRWIPSQCLNMLYNPCGFHRLLTLNDYNYSWKVVLDDLKKQVKLYKDRDIEGYADRNRWYNRRTVLGMATDYIKALRDRVEHLPRRMHGRRAYVRLSCHINNGKGIHLDEMKKLFFPLEKAIQLITVADTPYKLYESAQMFNKERKRINWKPEMSNAFTNAYKAAGGYYTIKDLIMFEGCKIIVNQKGSTAIGYNDKVSVLTKEQSLKALEDKVKEMTDERYGAANSGYIMLGLLKDFLKYNNFDFEKTKEKWHLQHEMRMAAKKRARRSRK